MTDDLLSRLTAALDEAERLAKAATPGPWRYVSRNIIDTPPIDPDEADWGPEGLSGLRIGTIQDPRAFRYADAAHIAAWSPDVALRHVEHARRVMARHAPYDREYPDLGCIHCSHEYAEAWPCPDLLDLLAFLLPGSVTE